MTHESEVCKVCATGTKRMHLWRRLADGQPTHGALGVASVQIG